MSHLQEQFNKDGFLILRGFFDPQEVKTLYEEAKQTFAIQIKRVLGNVPDTNDRDAFEQAMYDYFNADFESFVGTGKNVQHSLGLYRLNTDPRLVNLLQTLGIEKPIIGVKPAMQFNSRFLSKGGTHWRLGAHQDWRSGQGSLDSMVVWFPMVPCDHDLGVLQVVPGSHTHGLMEATGVSYEGALQSDYADEAYIEENLYPGDILIFSALLVHRSGNNVSNNIRWSVQYRFNNLAEPTFIERGYPHAYDYKPQQQLITPNFPTKEQIAQLYSQIEA
ncbi:MAG: phytanoyl-CoA dioxygenase family protein [Spirosomataceae bacterium]